MFIRCLNGWLSTSPIHLWVANGWMMFSNLENLKNISARLVARQYSSGFTGDLNDKRRNNRIKPKMSEWNLESHFVNQFMILILSCMLGQERLFCVMVLNSIEFVPPIHIWTFLNTRAIVFWRSHCKHNVQDLQIFIFAVLLQKRIMFHTGIWRREISAWDIFSVFSSSFLNVHLWFLRFAYLHYSRRKLAKFELVHFCLGTKCSFARRPPIGSVKTCLASVPVKWENRESG